MKMIGWRFLNVVMWLLVVVLFHLWAPFLFAHSVWRYSLRSTLVDLGESYVTMFQDLGLAFRGELI